jgi:hypothetical protein
VARARIHTSAFTFVKEIADGAVTLFDVLTGDERVVNDVAMVVMATMRKPVTPLRSLEGQVPYVYVVGDGLAPRGLREATYEGDRFARVIGEDSMPKRVMDEVFRGRLPLQPVEMVGAV